MRLALFCLLTCLGCIGNNDVESKSLLETSATSYVAVDDPDPKFDYAVTVSLRHRNTSDLIVRVSSCTATVLDPVYGVERVGSGRTAWNPEIPCAAFGAPYEDLAPGEERTYTLVLRAPWLRSFNGEPIGEIEGTFYLVLQTQICALVSASGACSPVNNFEYVRSNRFTITTP